MDKGIVVLRDKDRMAISSGKQREDGTMMPSNGNDGGLSSNLEAGADAASRPLARNGT